MVVDGRRARAGRLELAVRRELRELPEPVRKGALAELALFFARTIDAGGSQAALVKAGEQLRVTLGQLRELARDHDDGQEDGDLGTPAWDTEDAGPADAGSEGRGGGAAAR